MSLLIQEVPVAQAPKELLLLADPSEAKIRSYLSRSRCFLASCGALVVGTCVVQPRGTDVYELMCIAVHPAHQKSGYGTALLKWVIDFFRDSGVRQLEVGTGTFGYQLAFYQRHGFRVTSIDPDFFVRNYSQPVFEDGIQLLDMLRLTLRYSDHVVDPSAQAEATWSATECKR
ncbi:GNAT family N-acetyltransferase [Cyanobium sp. N.Huapi 1H5]|uniref:GNAT family N-acetyltransferase n=1 Tax=Cyanobium sp. N.Huapi 1H5 TaxID=2823719 RepID=UPI0020CDEF9B|nr:GNAT family N-acetyltransferase [Cyanobium sp. N.Huapi 1H5]MCP9837977.1 GNAT family N-acetyltransferase [Cyanobium sp. N.Huapi 1H5]